MADSKEQKLIDEIVTRLQAIRTTAPNTVGYQTDIGAQVADSETNWDEKDLPAVSVFQGTTETQPVANDREELRIHEMPVLIKVFLKSGTDAANARTAISDIFRAIRQDDRWKVTNIGLAMETRQKRHGIEYAKDSFEIVGAQVEIEIMYATSKFNAES
jgi:hypothetical protein